MGLVPQTCTDLPHLKGRLSHVTAGVLSASSQGGTSRGCEGLRGRTWGWYEAPWGSLETQLFHLDGEGMLMIIPPATTTILPIYVDMVPGIIVILFNFPPTQKRGTDDPSL